MFAAWTVMSCSTASEGVSLWRLRERKWTVRVERWEKRESRKRPERAGRWRGRRTSVALAAHWAFHAMNAPANACAVGEPVILLHPPLPSLGVWTRAERERQQSDSLADGGRRQALQSAHDPAHLLDWQQTHGCISLGTHRRCPRTATENGYSNRPKDSPSREAVLVGERRAVGSRIGCTADSHAMGPLYGSLHVSLYVSLYVSPYHRLHSD